MPSCNLLSFFAPLMGLAFFSLVASAAPTPISSSSFNDAFNISHTSTTISDSSIPLPSDYVSTVLFHHNSHRANHSASSLTYSSTLEAYASSVTQSCPSSGSLQPSINASYSTNTYAYYTSNSDDSSTESEQVARAISTWYNDELATYLASSADMTTEPEAYSGILHFSQIVWKDTIEVGCAATKCEEDTLLNLEDGFAVAWAVVCAYSSPGNCVGNACADDGFLGNVGSSLGMDYLGYRPFAS